MWKIRKAVGEHAKEIIGLHNLIYQTPKTEEEFLWLYQRNPNGPGQAWFATDQDNDAILSARPIFPWRVRVLGKEVIAAQAGDALTHPAYRRKGIFTSLMRAAWSDLAEQGIPFIYTFPNEASISIHRKVETGVSVHTGGYEVGRLRRMVKYLQTQQLLSPILGRNFVSEKAGKFVDVMAPLLTERHVRDCSAQVTITTVRRFDNRFDVLWNRASQAFSVIGVRDSKYLNWRYADNPKKRYILLSAERGEEVLGFAILEIKHLSNGLTEGYLAELFAGRDTRTVKHLIVEMADYCRKHGVARIVAWASEGCDYARALQSMGFIPRKDVAYFVVHVLSDLPYREVLLDNKNWFVTLGDRDV